MLDHKVAQEIVKETTKISGYNLIVTNNLAVIIGATELQRLGGFHPGLNSLFNGKEIFIEADEEKVKKFHPGMRQGIELPINFNDKVIGTVGIEGHPNEVRNYGGLIKSQVELMFKQFLLNERTGILLSAQEIFISNLISLDINSNQRINKLIDLANFLDLDLDLPGICFVIDIEKTTAIFQLNHTQKLLSLHESINNLIKSFFNEINHIYSFHGKTKIINFVLSTQSEEIMLEKIRNIRKKFIDHLNLSCNVGVGNCYKGVFGIKKSFDEAKTALHLATKFKAIINNGIIRMNDLHIEQILNDVTKSTKNNILNAACIQEFTQDPNDKLLETFFSLCENHLKVNQSAKKLYIHRNTLLYRINKIKKITNLDPTHFVDAAKLYLILKMKNL